MEWTSCAILNLFNELTLVILVSGLFAFSMHLLLISKRTQWKYCNSATCCKAGPRVLKTASSMHSGSRLPCLPPPGMKAIFPESFMSLIGLEFFRQIVVEKEILQPASILNEMNHYFDLVFANLEELSLKDGIDLAFCAYDYKKRTLEYAGAFNPVYIIRNNEILEVKGDRIIIGPDYGVQRGPFRNRTVEMEEDDVIYMFSDGYADQFGGPEGKKFKYRRFRHLLMTIHKLPMEEQHRKIEENINEWMGVSHDQIDDQLVIGIRPASFSSS